MQRRDGARPMDDRNRITHMRNAAIEARQFAANRPFADLESDRMLLRSLAHCLIEIGEAATKVSDPARALAPSVPWRQIVGMRHRIVHVYYDLDATAIWTVVTDDLEPLIAALGEALESLDQ